MGFEIMAEIAPGPLPSSKTCTPGEGEFEPKFVRDPAVSARGHVRQCPVGDNTCPRDRTRKSYPQAALVVRLWKRCLLPLRLRHCRCTLTIATEGSSCVACFRWRS